MKKVTVILGIAMLLSGSGDYISRLRSLQGSPYSQVNCSGLITKAKHHAQCSAREMWDGCGGDLALVEEVSSYAAVNLSALQDGDVLDFQGVHVAAVLDGALVDSIPERGVGRVEKVNRFDTWYAGKVRILRWRLS